MSGFWWPRRTAAVLGASLVLALGLAQRPTPLCAQKGDITAAPIELVLDASQRMRGRIGEVEKIEMAREFVRVLDEELASDGEPARLGLRVYGADSPRAAQNCRDSRLVIPAATREADLASALNALQPRGLAPLAHALESALADTARTYVLIAGGLGECGGDACGVWRELAARRTNRDARLHVVAIAQEAPQVELLKCLSRAGSGTFIVLSDAAEVHRAAKRLALILTNRGLIDIRLSLGSGESFTPPARVLVPRSREVVAALGGRGPHPVPAGIYSLVLDTAPPVTLDRVLVLPGETVTIERSDFGRLVVELRDRDNRALRAPLTVHTRPRAAEIHYGFTGDPVVLQSGSYDLTIDLGDSLLTRRDVVVEPGRIRRLVVGGAGTLLVVSPEFPEPPLTRVVLGHGGDSDTLLVGRAGRVPVGRYRVRVETMPIYVSDEVTVGYREATTVELPPLGLLRVAVMGPQGPLEGVVARLREPLTGERYGLISSGEARLVMPGRYRIDLETIPSQRIDDVVVRAGEETVVERRGLSRVVVSPPAPGGTYRLELLVAPGGRRLGETVGTSPSLTAFPGRYHARVFRGPALVWEGEVDVAPDRPARIDLPRP